MRVRNLPTMAESKDDKTVMYLNSKTGFGSLRTVNGVDSLIYISDTDMEKGALITYYGTYKSTFRFIYGYLLTFSIWRLSLSFILV
jgi:hypothetical protein